MAYSITRAQTLNADGPSSDSQAVLLPTSTLKALTTAEPWCQWHNPEAIGAVLGANTA